MSSFVPTGQAPALVPNVSEREADHVAHAFKSVEAKALTPEVSPTGRPSLLIVSSPAYSACCSTPGPMASQLASTRPHALESWTALRSAIGDRRPVLFIDYDGTLAAIVRDPDKAFMTESMRAALGRAAKVFTTAIITGRSKDKVPFLPPPCAKPAAF